MRLRNVFQAGKVETAVNQLVGTGFAVSSNVLAFFLALLYLLLRVSWLFSCSIFCLVFWHFFVTTSSWVQPIQSN